MNKESNMKVAIDPTMVVQIRMYGGHKNRVINIETTWEEIFIDNPDLQAEREEMEKRMSTMYSCSLGNDIVVFRMGSPA